MMNEREIREGLVGFTGSETFLRYSPLFPNVVITEGVIWLAENAQCYWLLDVIASHLPAVQRAGETFAVVMIERTSGSGATVAIVDDIPANTIYADQLIEYTDFPLAVLKMYVGYDSENWTVMLIDEY